MKKVIEPTRIKIDGVDFAIYPFDAFYAANISAVLMKTLTPIVADLFPALKGLTDGLKIEDGEKMTTEKFGEEAMKKLQDTDISALAEPIANACASLDGDEFEDLLKKLLVNKQNVAIGYVDGRGVYQTDYLTIDTAGDYIDLIGMIQLAIAVVNLNYSDFFVKLFARFGDQPENQKASKSPSMESSIMNSSTN